MYKAFIEPDLNAAQLKIHNSFNPFTGFMNATYILKAKRQEVLTQQAVVAVLGVSVASKKSSSHVYLQQSHSTALQLALHTAWHTWQVHAYKV
jgi:hypothetical protein